MKHVVQIVNKERRSFEKLSLLSSSSSLLLLFLTSSSLLFYYIIFCLPHCPYCRATLIYHDPLSAALLVQYLYLAFLHFHCGK